MSVQKHQSSITAHHVNTAMAHLFERTFRHIKLSTTLLMGNASCPCDPFSCPEADGTLDLAFDSMTGLITIDSYDLRCVAASRICPTNCSRDHRHHFPYHHGPCHENACNHNHRHYNYVHRHLGHLPHGHFDVGKENHVAHLHGNHNHHPYDHGFYHHGYCDTPPNHDGRRYGWHNHFGNHGWHDYHPKHCGTCGKDESCCRCSHNHHHHRRPQYCSPYSGELVKVITINCPPEVSDTRKVIYLFNTTETECDDEESKLPVRIFLTNNGRPIPGPQYYLLAPGEIRYLIIEFGRIVSIEN